MKDDILLSATHPLFHNIFYDYAISVFSCENSSPDVSTFDHSHDTWDVSASFDYGEEQNFFLNPLNLSSFLSGNLGGEIFCFSSTPLYDSSGHEDANVHFEFSKCGCCDLFTHSLNHDVDSLVVDLFKPPIFNETYVGEVETPQAIKALMPELMRFSQP